MSVPDIKGYKLIKRLGKGAFGEVYKALEIQTDNIVAIKVEAKEKISRLEHEKDFRMIHHHHSNATSHLAQEVEKFDTLLNKHE